MKGNSDRNPRLFMAGFFNICLRTIVFNGLIFIISLLIPGEFLSSTGAYSLALAGNKGDDEKVKNLREEKRLLEAELNLIQDKTTYIILDPSAKKIYIKNRGIILRELDIAGIKYWRGVESSIVPVRLTRKKAPFSPRRDEIKPHKPEDPVNISRETNFLETNNMPYKYTLIYENEVYVSVIAIPESGLMFHLKNIIDSVSKHVKHSITIVRNHLLRKNFTIIDLVMSKEDAQALFWVLQEGTKIIIRRGWSSI